MMNKTPKALALIFAVLAGFGACRAGARIGPVHAGGGVSSTRTTTTTSSVATNK
jgi:hypothetical protein